jgi:hypothetical protein
VRTRRSWRNQSRLWRELGQQGEAVAIPPEKPRDPYADVPIAERWWLSKRTRAMLQRDAEKKARRAATPPASRGEGK